MERVAFADHGHGAAGRRVLICGVGNSHFATACCVDAGWHTHSVSGVVFVCTCTIACAHLTLMPL